MPKGKKRKLRITDDNNSSFSIPPPESFSELLSVLSDHFDTPEGDIQCYTADSVDPITNTEEYEEVVAEPEAEIRVAVLMSVSEYFGEEGPVDLGEDSEQPGDQSQGDESQPEASRSRPTPAYNDRKQREQDRVDQGESDQSDPENDSEPASSDQSRSEHDSESPSESATETVSHITMRLVDDSYVAPTGPFVVRTGQGYIKCWDLSSGDIVRTSMPIADIHSRVCVMDDTVFISGGINRPSLFCKYSTTTRKVAMLPDLPRLRYDHAMCVHNSEIVVLGGFCGRQLSHCGVFKKSWKDLPSLVYSRQGHSALSCFSTLYVVGGVSRGSVELLTNEAEGWETAEFRVELIHAGLCALEEGEILVVGGCGRKTMARAFAINVESGEEREYAELPYADTFCSEGVRVDERIYLLGTSHCYSLDLDSSVWQLDGI